MPTIYLTYTLGDGETLQTSIAADGDRPDLIDDMVTRANAAFGQQLCDVMDIVHGASDTDDEEVEPEQLIISTLSVDELNALMANGDDEDEQ